MDARGVSCLWVTLCLLPAAWSVESLILALQVIDKQEVGGRQLWGALSWNSGTVSLLMYSSTVTVGI